MQISNTTENGVTRISITYKDDDRILIDPDAPALFRQRGIADDALTSFLERMVDGDQDAFLKLGMAIPSVTMPRREDGVIIFEAVLSETVTWACTKKASALRIQGLPDTIANGVVGTAIGKVVDHPAINGARTITSAEAAGDDWLLHLSGAPAPYQNQAATENDGKRTNTDRTSASDAGFPVSAMLAPAVVMAPALIGAIIIHDPGERLLFMAMGAAFSILLVSVIMLLHLALREDPQAVMSRTRRPNAKPIVIDTRQMEKDREKLAEAVKAYLQAA